MKRCPILSDLPSAVRRKVATTARSKKFKTASDPTSVRDALFTTALATANLPTPHREYRFHDTRLWRFDWAWPQQSVALEVDGGIWRQGRHTRGAGWLKDTEKLNTAAATGWRLLRCTPQMLATPELLATLRLALEYRL